MTEATEPIGGPEVRYGGRRVDGTEYDAAVVCDDRVEGSVLFDLWNVDFDDERAVLKEPASGRYRQEAIKRLRREASLMRRLAGRGGQTRRLSPFLGSGDRRTPSDSSAPHPHHFTRECDVLVNLIAGAQNVPPLRKAARANLVVDAFAALTELHAADVIHRDLKPGNLVVEPLGSGGGPLIEFIDFGHGLDLTLPPAADEPATGEDAVAGTEGWMCPHCYDERTRDPLCDVFAMALVGAAILLGQTRALLPGVRSNRVSTGMIAPMGLPTRAEKEALRASLGTLRDGLVERGEEGTDQLMLAVLVDALTPEPRGAEGEALRPTAQEIHDRLVEVRAPRPMASTVDHDGAGSDEAGAAPEDLPPPALVPVPDLEDASPPDAAAAVPFDQDHDVPPSELDEVAELEQPEEIEESGPPPAVGGVEVLEPGNPDALPDDGPAVDGQEPEPVPPLMGDVGGTGDEPVEAGAADVPAPVSPWDLEPDGDDGVLDGAVPVEPISDQAGDAPRDDVDDDRDGYSGSGGGEADPSAQSKSKSAPRPAASLPHPQDVAAAATRLQGAATPAARLPFRRDNLLTAKGGVGRLPRTREGQLLWIAIGALLLLAFVIVVVVVQVMVAG